MKIISLRELREMLDAGSVDLIDVREGHEWSSGYIDGARHVPLDQLKANLDSIANEGIVFVCARGLRSISAAEIAENAGKEDVYSLDGGTVGWASAGFDIVVPERSKSEVASLESEVELDSEPDSPALDALVALNLQAQRAAQGWSLDDLAREAGVSRTLLGQIELGRAVPSIGIVWKIAQTLGVPFSTLLSTEPPGGTLVTERATAKRLYSADGRFSSRALFPLGEPTAPEFYELWLAPYSREDAEPHRPGTRENLVVTAGELQLHIERDVRTLRAGDAAVFSADVSHSYVNLGRDECWFYLVMSYH